MKVLVIIDSWTSKSYCAGSGAIFRLIKEVAMSDVEVHLVCSLKEPVGDFGKKVIVHFCDLRWIKINKGFFSLFIAVFLFILKPFF